MLKNSGIERGYGEYGALGYGFLVAKRSASDNDRNVCVERCLLSISIMTLQRSGQIAQAYRLCFHQLRIRLDQRQ